MDRVSIKNYEGRVVLVQHGTSKDPHNPPTVRLMFVEDGTGRVLTSIEMSPKEWGNLVGGFRNAKGVCLVNNLRSLPYVKTKVVEVAVDNTSSKKSKERIIKRWKKKGWDVNEADLNNPYRFICYGKNHATIQSVRLSKEVKPGKKSKKKAKNTFDFK